MVVYVYIPDDICGSGWFRKAPAGTRIVGFCIDGAYVVVDFAGPCDLESIEPGLRVIGSINQGDGEPHEAHGTHGETPGETHGETHLETPLEAPGEPSPPHLRLSFDDANLPYVVGPCPKTSYSIILFSPPNLRNFEYYTCSPVMLQSTGQEARDHSLIEKIAQSHAQAPKNTPSLCNDVLLDTINRSLQIRSRLRKRSSKKRTLKFAKPLAAVVHWTLSLTLYVLVSAISLLNYKVRGFVPVQASSWCRQLDIRLRQISFFPLQFMSYRDHRFLSQEVRAQLRLPSLNTRHNINNSNYINLYNTIWLIVNDVLWGRSLYRLAMAYRHECWRILNQTLKMLFGQLDQLITWIGSGHPGGFKLNNDLGPFLESMFLWTSQVWTGVFDRLVALESDSWTSAVFKLWFAVSCSCGCSFLIAGFIDYIKLCCLHLYFFNKVSTKIYHQQIAMLQSLTQLFRGRKYNVLRNRIDSIEQDKFHIDQLFLGTLCFITMVYLLPTTFAFHMLFFLARLSMLTVLKLGEKVIVCSNLLPLFVLLLKLKNSRRLQGGVFFKQIEGTECVAMKNKALTFEEIFENFISVLHQEGKFERLALNFLEGKELKLRDTSSMKFHYLMLPGNIESLLDVWSKQAPN